MELVQGEQFILPYQAFNLTLVEALI